MDSRIRVHTTNEKSPDENTRTYIYTRGVRKKLLINEKLTVRIHPKHAYTHKFKQQCVAVAGTAAAAAAVLENMQDIRFTEWKCP